jgi:hypothetical protein
MNSVVAIRAHQLGKRAGRLYRWHWRARLPERHGQLLRVLVVGALNSCLVEFVGDGWRVVTSRNAFRRVDSGQPEQGLNGRVGNGVGKGLEKFTPGN